MGFIYLLGKTSIGLYMRFTYKIKITGHENIPKKGSAILCCNHLSVIDPMILASCIKRPVHFLAKKELYTNWFFKFILKGCKTIPIDRSRNDTEAYKKTLDVLKKGKMAGIFAAGTRKKEGEDETGAKSGVALFAAKSGAPVIPVCISASYKKRSPVYINIGKPVDLTEFLADGQKIKSSVINEMAAKIMRDVTALSIEVE